MCMTKKKFCIGIEYWLCIFTGFVCGFVYFKYEMLSHSHSFHRTTESMLCVVYACMHVCGDVNVAYICKCVGCSAVHQGRGLEISC